MPLNTDKDKNIDYISEIAPIDQILLAGKVPVPRLNKSEAVGRASEAAGRASEGWEGIRGVGSS